MNTNIYMRGIGSGNNRGFEQSVGMYLEQSFDTPILAGSHTRFMDEGAVFGVRGTLKF